jgi:hypothetical protein
MQTDRQWEVADKVVGLLRVVEFSRLPQNAMVTRPFSSNGQNQQERRSDAATEQAMASYCPDKISLSRTSKDLNAI